MHCPQCGQPTPEAAAVCPFCGFRVENPAAGAGKPMARTMVGIPQSVAAAARAAVAASGGQAPEVSEEAATIALNRAPPPGTIVGLSPAAMLPGSASTASPLGAVEPHLQTRVGFRPPLADINGGALPADKRGAAGEPAPAAAAKPGASPSVSPIAAAIDPKNNAEKPGTARASDRPPVAPTRNGEERPGRNGYHPAEELGATVAPRGGALQLPAKRLKGHALHAPRLEIPPLKPPKIQKPQKPQKKKEKGARAITALLVGAGVITAGAIAFAVLWSGRGPLSARVRTDAQGVEVVELSCPSCPDGTVISSGQSSAKVAGAVAALTPEKPLSPGENRLKVRIDRPANGRDETVTVAANVAYRIRSDLSALQADRPAIQVVVEAAKGAQVKLDGKAVPLYAGRVTETFDVTEACTGLAADATSLSRQIPYVVTTPEGEEKGSLNVTVGVVPLELEAPGPNVVIDGPSFVIAGRTLKGAELLAAGKPIPVKPDGSFAHVMNVSSVGATQIEVRAKIAGMAPRITKIKVRRVDSIETAAREFAAESPIPFSALTPSIAQQAGKAIVVAGLLLDVQREGRKTIMLMEVGPPAGCQGCSARLLQGAENPAQVGDKITAYGHVVRAVRLPERGEIPEIQVDFTLKGQR